MIDFITEFSYVIGCIILMIWVVLYSNYFNRSLDLSDEAYKKAKKAEELKSFSDKFNATK